MNQVKLGIIIGNRDFFTPTADQLAGLGALLVVCAGLASIGAALSGKKRLAEADLVVGWAAASLLFTVGGGLLRLGFTSIAVAIAVAAALSAVVMTIRERTPVCRDVMRSVVLMLPLLWLAACMAISIARAICP